MSEQADARTGAELGGRYRLVRRLGEGGMGEVWEAEDAVLERRVAVKLVSGRQQGDPAVLARFEREAQTGARLSHPGLATVYDYGTAPEGVYLVMELLAGETLAERLRHGPLPVGEATDVVAQAADALAAAHAAGVIHRDVKPSNLMLTPGGVKVMDFGIATGEGDPLTATGLVIGTAAYLAPERAQGRSAGPEADVYGLGLVLVEAVTGEPAVSGATPAETVYAHVHGTAPDLGERPDVPAAVADATRRALAKEPAARPSAAELAALLRAGPRGAPTTVVAPVDAGTATAALPPAVPAPVGAAPWADPGPGDRAGRGGLVALAVVALLLIAGAAYALASRDDTGDRTAATATTAASAPPTTSAVTEPAPTTAAPTTAPPTTAAPTTTAPPVTAAVSPASDPGTAAVTYLETLRAGDVDAAWALTSPAFQAAQDRDSWESFWTGHDVEIVGDPRVAGSSGRVVVPVTFDGAREDYAMTLVQADDGTWLVDGPVGG